MTKRDGMMTWATRVANFGIVVGAGAALSIFFYFFYHYALIGDRRFPATILAVAYYGVPLTVACLLLASFRLSPSYRINLVLLMVTSVLSVYVAEGTIRWRSSTLY